MSSSRELADVEKDHRIAFSPGRVPSLDSELGKKKARSHPCWALSNRPTFFLQRLQRPLAGFSASSLRLLNEKSATRRCQEAIPFARAASRTRCAKATVGRGACLVPKGTVGTQQLTYFRSKRRTKEVTSPLHLYIVKQGNAD